MSPDLFAGMPVADYARAVGWYERLLGSPPSFLAHETEAVWEVADHRFVYVVEDPERAGNGLVTLFVEDLEAVLSAIAERGLDPATSDNGVRKATFRDPDGNEVGVGGAPA